MNIGRSVSGVVEVELTSANPEAALAFVNQAGIVLTRMQKTGDLTCRFLILRKDFVKLQNICEKKGEKLSLLRKGGLYWTIRKMQDRPFLIMGLLFLFFMVLFLPTRVFFVRVEGNVHIPAKRILAAAEDSGICFGASRREVRSEKVKNALLSSVPELQWAGINTSGCVATISVRERTDKETANEEKAVTNIVAARDGYILSGTVTSGNAVFRVGQTVKAGQLLISGYTDCGICVRATRSAGEIFAQTDRDLTVMTPSVCMQREEIQRTKQKISLIFQKKRINLWKDSGISDTSCGRMYEEYYINLPGGFRLPVALCVETFSSYSMQDTEISETVAEKRMTDFADSYLQQQMIAGAILEKSYRMDTDEGIYSLSVNYTCTEMIGREQQEQIGDTNGKIG